MSDLAEKKTEVVGPPEPGPQDLPPAFGDYEVLERIGAGGMGVVHRARSRSLSRMVAIKVLKDAGNASGAVVSRFLQEARALARVAHPGVDRVLEVGELLGRPFLAMEYVEGSTLKRLMGKGLSLERRLAIFRRLLGAVSAIHDLGVMHRDIKPENVIVGADD
ncbi:MAG: serine/threonine protein kinase, partial [Planctomycetes bacterium]|nr:serine/threonine protein kinase [Planctomycetota bacterium]